MPNHVMVRSLCLGVSRVKQSAESGLFLYYSLGFVIAIITILKGHERVVGCFENPLHKAVLMTCGK